VLFNASPFLFLYLASSCRRLPSLSAVLLLSACLCHILYLYISAVSWRYRAADACSRGSFAGRGAYVTTGGWRNGCGRFGGRMGGWAPLPRLPRLATSRERRWPAASPSHTSSLSLLLPPCFGLPLSAAVCEHAVRWGVLWRGVVFRASNGTLALTLETAQQSWRAAATTDVRAASA